jgi:hypothetical protein
MQADTAVEKEALPTDTCTLETLETSAGPVFPALYAMRSSFVVNVASTVDSVRLTAKATDPRATIRLRGKELTSGKETDAYPLSAGRNVFPVEVTAADGKTKRTYTLAVIRLPLLPNWVRVMEKGPFKIRDSEGELHFNGRMWILGGYTPELQSDIWSSAEGVNWTQAGTIPDESGVNIPVQFVHAGRMWVTTNNGKFWSSSDGANWTLVTDSAPWAGRYAAGSAAFRGRMWVIGGSKDGKLFNDVWSSENGVDWKLETAEAAWSRRQVFGNLVVHNDRLFLIGGGITGYQPFRAYRDVWSSADGREWTRVTDHAPFEGRIWSQCISFRGRLWLMGGYQSQPVHRNLNDVWYSVDGAEWRQLHTEHIWEPRHEASLYVHDDELWLVAGNAWPLMNDAWKFDVKGLSFLTPPVVEEIVLTQHRYEARADFNRGGGPVKYRLKKSPAWMSVDEKTGVVSGIPPEMGEFAVELEAYDDAGERVTQAYVLHVIKAP